MYILSFKNNDFRLIKINIINYLEKQYTACLINISNLSKQFLLLKCKAMLKLNGPVTGSNY